VGLSIFDLKCVGAVFSACVAHEGHTNIVVDTNPSKQPLDAGQAALVESGLSEPVDAAVPPGRLTVTTDPREASYKSGFSVLSVSKAAKSEPDLSDVTEASRQIVGDARKRERSHFKYPARTLIRACDVTLKCLVAVREPRMRCWNCSDAIASNSEPRPIRTIVRLAS
jgi:GDP-mannose 6-dehydrogenase